MSCAVLPACSPTSIYVDLLGTRAALDVTAPVVLTVAPMSDVQRLDRVAPAAAHRSATARTRVFLLALADMSYAYNYMN